MPIEEIITEVVSEIAGEAVESVLTSKRTPKILRCAFLGFFAAVCIGFGIFIATQTEFILGLIVSLAVTFGLAALCIGAIVRIIREKPAQPTATKTAAESQEEAPGE